MLNNHLKKLLILFIILNGFIRAQIFSEKDVEICNSKFQLAVDESLTTKLIGDVIVEIGKSFIGTEYVAHTLEKGKKESLVINLTGLDCTTFLENCLVFSRLIKMNETTFQVFQKQLRFERYRKGKINGYPSRLHYFTDWIYDGEKKGIVEDITKSLGGIPYDKKINFMTTHRKAYEQLSNDEFYKKVGEIETEINKRKLYYIPKDEISKTENKIHNGDLIAITTNIEGLDVSHVGIAIKMPDGKIHYLHAPDVGQKVQITEKPLADYIAAHKTQTGIIVCRALEPKKTLPIDHKSNLN